MSDYIGRNMPIERINRKLEEVYSYPKTEYAEGYVNACNAAVRMLKELPAVDAIPVDWILKYATEKDSYRNICFVRNNIRTMLERWKEENE